MPLEKQSAVYGIPSTRRQRHPIGGQVYTGDIVSTNPMEQDACWVEMGSEQREGLLVLALRRGGTLQMCPVGSQDGPPFDPDVSPEGRGMAMGIQGKKEGISVIEHGRQDSLNKRIIGIDQHVIGLEIWERKCQMQHSTRGIANKACPNWNPPSAMAAGPNAACW